MPVMRPLFVTIYILRLSFGGGNTRFNQKSGNIMANITKILLNLSNILVDALMLLNLLAFPISGRI